MANNLLDADDYLLMAQLEAMAIQMRNGARNLLAACDKLIALVEVIEKRKRTDLDTEQLTLEITQ